MAPRARKRPVIDTVAGARAELATVNLLIGRHVTGCGQCFRAGADAARGCDDGWELARRQARARAAVRRAEQAASSRPAQGVLW